MRYHSFRRCLARVCRDAALGLVCLSSLMAWTHSASADEADSGFKPIFDGKTLEGWDGNPKFWSVQDGAITGQTTADNPTNGNTFIIWKNGTPGDFELKLEYRIVGGNSGVQYRSFRLDNAPDQWRIGGYQADIDSGTTWSGTNYGERFRGVLAKRGEKAAIDENGKRTVTGEVGDSDELQKKIKQEDWNEYHITAKGDHFVHKINGTLMSEFTDHDKQRRADGLIALQLHAGPPMKVQFRNLRLKTLDDAKTGQIRKPGDGSHTRPQQLIPVKFSGQQTKKIVLIAGPPSHGYGAHEHKAGCMLLADALNQSGLPVNAEVVTGGWPKDTAVLDDAAAIVIYCDGGGRHPFNAHLEEIDALMDRGVGLVCIHYAVEVPKGKSGEAFLDWTGGYFETDWSVNPHWTAKFEQLPQHPVTRGVQPFSINDEWYYHMRFREEMEGVTPILSDLPPAETLKRGDGPHSNNPFVRKAVLEEQQPQHTAWARERADGGRGFGFTGGHNHWNWGNDSFRKLVLNSIVWAAKLDVPKNGVQSKSLTVDDLMANQDYDPPANFNKARIQAMLEEWNSK